jgi:flagellin
MALIVQTNMPAIKSQRHLGFTQNSLSKSIERLSSGLRINSPGDDASGLSIAETLKNQRMGFDRAYLNAQDGLSMLQVADGTLSQINSMLSRIRELAIQSANGVYNANDRTIIQREVDQLKDEINRLSYSAEFNTKKLLNGDSAGYWSSNSPNFDVVMNGNIKSGNYRFVTDTTFGQCCISNRYNDASK